MKMHIFFLGMLFNLFTTVQSQNFAVNEALYEVRNNWGLEKDSFRTYKVWIKDSLAIHEEKDHFSYDSSGINIYNGYDVYKYVYTDLKTKNRYDYYFLSDTATSGCRYIVSDSCFPVPKVICQDRYTVLDSLVKMQDTIINQKLYKRIKYVERHEAYNYSFEYIYYLVKSVLKNTFLVDNCNIIQEQYPGYTTERVDFYSTSPSPHTFTTEIRMLSSSLTEEEKRIFVQWKKNASVSSMPIISCEEVRKRFEIPSILRSDPRFKNYNPANWDVKL